MALACFVVVDVDIHAAAGTEDRQVHKDVYREIMVVARGKVQPGLQVVCRGAGMNGAGRRAALTTRAQQSINMLLVAFSMQQLVAGAMQRGRCASWAGTG